MKRFPNVRWMYGRFRFWRTLTAAGVVAGSVAVYADHIGLGLLLWFGAWIANGVRKFWEVRVWGHLTALHTSNATGEPPAHEFLSTKDQRRLNGLARDRFKAQRPK